MNECIQILHQTPPTPKHTYTRAANMVKGR